MEPESTIPGRQLDLMELVVQPTWREFLHELINSNQMNPWEVDITIITDKYLEKVRELSAMDLRLPANVILASAILLRFKAEALSFEEARVEEFIDDEPLEARVLIAEDIPSLVMRTNNPRTRKLTLPELITAIEEVMGESSKQQQLFPAAPKAIQLEIPKEDMHELIRRAYALANELKDQEGMLAFSELLDPNQMKDGNMMPHIVTRLLPILHLVQDRKMDISQAEKFGEITLKVL